MMQKNISNPPTLVITLILLSSLCVVDMAEQINFQYSMKNIPIPPKQEYHLELIHSVREFEKRIKNSTSADGGPRSRVRERGTLRSAPHWH